jgi:hypothetical protein
VGQWVRAQASGCGSAQWIAKRFRHINAGTFKRHVNAMEIALIELMQIERPFYLLKQIMCSPGTARADVHTCCRCAVLRLCCMAAQLKAQ